MSGSPVSAMRRSSPITVACTRRCSPWSRAWRQPNSRRWFRMPEDLGRRALKSAPSPRRASRPPPTGRLVRPQRWLRSGRASTGTRRRSRSAGSRRGCPTRSSRTASSAPKPNRLSSNCASASTACARRRFRSTESSATACPSLSARTWSRPRVVTRREGCVRVDNQQALRLLQLRPQHHRRGFHLLSVSLRLVGSRLQSEATRTSVSRSIRRWLLCRRRRMPLPSSVTACWLTPSAC